MASSYASELNRDPNCEWNKDLQEAARLIQKVARQLGRAGCSEDQTDNAYSTGTTAGTLYCALMLVLSELPKETVDAVHNVPYNEDVSGW